MAAKSYPDETGKPASSKVSSKTGLSDWQERFIEDKAKQKFGEFIGGDKAGAWIAAERKKAAEANKPKGTQAGHAVTNNDNHTKPVSPAEKQAQAKRPAVGNDKAAAKEFGSKSWNNGYTN